MGRFSDYDTLATYDAACAFAKGRYQQAILDGNEAISGSTLAGKALLWKRKYQESSRALVARLRANAFDVRIVRGQFGRHVLTISRPAYKQPVGRLSTAHGEFRLLPGAPARGTATIRAVCLRGWQHEKMLLAKYGARGVRIAAINPEYAPLGYLRSVRRQCGTT